MPALMGGKKLFFLHEAKVDKTNKNIYNLFLQNFLAPLPKYYSNAQEKDLFKLSTIFKNGRAEKHFINFLEYNNFEDFSDYQVLQNLSDARTLKTLQIIEISIKIFQLFNKNK